MSKYHNHGKGVFDKPLKGDDASDDDSEYTQELSHLSMPSLAPSLDDIEQRQMHSGKKAGAKSTKKSPKEPRSVGASWKGAAHSRDSHGQVTARDPGARSVSPGYEFYPEDYASSEADARNEFNRDHVESETKADRSGSSPNVHDDTARMDEMTRSNNHNDQKARKSRSKENTSQKAEAHGVSGKSKSQVSLLTFLLVIVGFSAATYFFYEDNQRLSSKQLNLIERLDRYEQRLGLLDQSVISVGTETTQSEQILEQRLKGLEYDLKQLNLQLERLVPNLEVADNALVKLQAGFKGLQKEVPLLQKATADQSKRLSGIEAELKEQLVNDIQQSVSKISEKMITIENRVTNSEASSEKISNLQKERLDGLEKNMDSYDNSIQKHGSAIKALQQTTSSQDLQEAIDSLSLEMYQLKGSFEKRLEDHDGSIKSINLFRRQVIGDIEQIKNDIRDFKNPGRNPAL